MKTSTDTITPKQPAPAKPENLATQIIQQVDRAPGDHVTCRHIYGDHYRCNWWQSQSTAAYDNPAMSGLLVTTHRVRKSQFLKVTKSASGLKIEPAVS
jgi:hypothetical protein